MIIVLQQQSGDAQFVQQTGGRILKEHLKKKGQKNREKIYGIFFIQNNVMQNIVKKSTALPPTHSRKCRVNS